MIHPKMLKMLSVLFTVLLLMSCASVDKKKETQTKPETFMWKLTSDTATVYMLGSIHLGQKDMYPLHEKIEKAYESSDYLVVEADISMDKMAQMQVLTMKYGMFSDGRTLKSVLSEETYAKLDTELKSVNLNAAALNAFKPWLVILTLSTLKANNQQMDAQLGIDMYFLTKARETPKTILELESIEFQLQLFDSISMQDQVKYIEQALVQNTDESKGLIEKLVTAWKNADPKEMAALIEKNKKKDSIDSILFGKRDEDMAEKIVGYLSTDKTYFVVVGAGHLAGKHSIIDNLKKKGYQPIQQ